ncbi:MAG: hemerythrin domain-containing protein [Neisseriaceae bacterium]|nr:hemerythrin domain-containing protein [Neisseriaceae bacterium]
MKRHPRLQPFSREHHQALSLGLALTQQRPGAQALLASQKNSLLQHFEEEERQFAPLFAIWSETQLSDRFYAEHQQLRAALASPNPNEQQSLGQALIDHVRFEERVLFVAIEAHWQATPHRERA